MLQYFAAAMDMRPDPVAFVLVFFTYSFMGYVMECIVLSLEHRRRVLNRGFVNHLPFCIIYGFGAMLGYALLSPVKNNLVLLFVFGAIGATGFEYLVARMQTYLFGDFWWDYSHKRFNYKGVLCLESTLGWGFTALVVVHFLQGAVVHTVEMVPAAIAAPLALLLVVAYTGDFICSARVAVRRRADEARQSEISIELLDIDAKNKSKNR